MGGAGSDHGLDNGGADLGGGLDTDIGGLDMADIGGLDADIGGGLDTDIIGGIDADSAGDLDTHNGSGIEADSNDSPAGPSLFNPLVLASAITTFGGVGLAAMKGFGMSGLTSTIIALGFAGAIGAALFFGIVKFMYGSQSNTIFSLNDLVGREAEVFTPIPKDGLGEIAYVSNGIRYTMTAKSLEGEDIGRSAKVTIREIAGSVAIVQRKLTLDEIELS